jgi:hypothetical protein
MRQNSYHLKTALDCLNKPDQLYINLSNNIDTEAIQIKGGPGKPGKK